MHELEPLPELDAERRSYLDLQLRAIYSERSFLDQERFEWDQARQRASEAMLAAPSTRPLPILFLEQFGEAVQRNVGKTMVITLFAGATLVHKMRSNHGR